MNWLVINFKTYSESTGKDAVRLAKQAGKDKRIILAVQPTDIYRVKQESPLTLYAQHVDPVEPDRNTGYIPPKAVIEAGAKGTLLNHAERRLSFNDIVNAVETCRQYKLKTMVCAPNISQAKRLIDVQPDFIAYEDPELIGTGKSVSTLQPDLIRKFAGMLNGTGIIPLCGAGISTTEDVQAAIELGTKGVLVASAIVKAQNPKKVIEDFLEALG